MVSILLTIGSPGLRRVPGQSEGWRCAEWINEWIRGFLAPTVRLVTFLLNWPVSDFSFFATCKWVSLLCGTEHWICCWIQCFGGVNGSLRASVFSMACIWWLLPPGPCKDHSEICSLQSIWTDFGNCRQWIWIHGPLERMMRRCSTYYQVHPLHDLAPLPKSSFPSRQKLRWCLVQFVTVPCVPCTESQSPCRGDSGESLRLCAFGREGMTRRGQEVR